MADPDPLMAALRQRRLELGLSQRALAVSAGLRQVYVSAWELSQRDIKLATLRRWLAGLDAELALVLQPAGDDCDGCVEALAGLLRDNADTLATLMPTGRARAACNACGRVRTYGLWEVPGG